MACLKVGVADSQVACVGASQGESEDAQFAVSAQSFADTCVIARSPTSDGGSTVQAKERRDPCPARAGHVRKFEVPVRGHERNVTEV